MTHEMIANPALAPSAELDKISAECRIGEDTAWLLAQLADERSRRIDTDSTDSTRQRHLFVLPDNHPSYEIALQFYALVTLDAPTGDHQSPESSLSILYHAPTGAIANLHCLHAMNELTTFAAGPHGVVASTYVPHAANPSVDLHVSVLLTARRAKAQKFIAWCRELCGTAGILA